MSTHNLSLRAKLQKMSLYKRVCITQTCLHDVDSNQKCILMKLMNAIMTLVTMIFSVRDTNFTS